MPTAVAVACGGALGGLARWGLAEALGAGGQHGDWPWGTLLANLAGALVLGVVAARLLAEPTRRLSDRTGAFLGPGLCGALTTFSALQLEVVSLVRDDHATTAITYLAVTVALGLAAARGGWIAGGGRPATADGTRR